MTISERGNEQLSGLSLGYLASRPKDERKSIGQFLTPRALRDALVKHVGLAPGMRVLDPGVGTGEFLATCRDACSDLELEGWDIDEPALDVARQLVPEAKLELRSALDAPPSGAFDVVIGNPPYYEMRSMDVAHKKAYASVISGRPNIFSLFFAVGLNQLRPGGRLAYVVPPSMNNGAYFANLRSHILERGAVEYLEVIEDKFLFADVQTAVQLIVIRKGQQSSRYAVDLGELSGSPKHRIMFSAHSDAIRGQYAGRSSLWALGYEAVTGTVVWNTKKDQLRREAEESAIPLIWAHNIQSAREIILTPEHPKKPQYVLGVKAEVGPAVVVNRITGSVGTGSLRCALIPPGMAYVGENHVNVIRARRGARQAVGWDQLLALLRTPGVNERVRLLTGNTQLSASELTHWLPLDIEAGQAESQAMLPLSN